MTDPTELVIEPGDPEQVITQDDADAGLDYIVEVEDNLVQYAHRKQNASRGIKLVPGQTHVLGNLRREEVWLAATEGEATVRVRPAGASLNSLPPKDVTVEGDVNIPGEVDVKDDQTRELGKARLTDSDGVLVEPAAEATLSEVVSNTSDVSTESTLSDVLVELETQTTLLEQIEENTS